MSKNEYLARRDAREKAVQRATRQTFQQYMTDLFIMTLNDPEIMGKDVFGYERIDRIMKGIGRKYDQYFDALTKSEEADYYRAKMDEVIRRIMRDSPEFKTFEQRYDYLPEIRYDLKK